jgi:hypothetical protein
VELSTTAPFTLIVRVIGSPDVLAEAHIPIFPEAFVTNTASHKVALVSVRVIDIPVLFCMLAGVPTGKKDTGGDS